MKILSLLFFFLSVLSSIGVCLTAFAGPSEEETPTWRKHTINDRSPFEAVGVADFNGDGFPDVFSGDSWYEAPTWTRHKVRRVSRGLNPHYHEDFADLPLDVNRDGHMDIVTCAYFGKRIGWVEHPGDPAKPWIEHTIDLPGSMETGVLVDLNGDGRPEFLPNVGGQNVWYELVSQKPDVKWEKHNLGKTGAGHGNGYGDVNLDGRIDIITSKGWFEQPAEASSDDAWIFHDEFQLGSAGIRIIGRDFDDDGDTDILWGMGHDFGLYWLKQSKDENGTRAWSKELIDDTFSQVHTLITVDLDGDDRPEVVTGKRIYAHEREKGATDSPCLYSFQFDTGTSRWNKRVIYEGNPATNAPENPKERAALDDFERGSAGTGLYMEARDMDGDGDQDLICPGKSGLYWFENLRLSRQ